MRTEGFVVRCLCVLAENQSALRSKGFSVRYLCAEQKTNLQTCEGSLCVRRNYGATEETRNQQSTVQKKQQNQRGQRTAREETRNCKLFAQEQPRDCRPSIYLIWEKSCCRVREF